jgi:hypothetical protein
MIVQNCGKIDEGFYLNVLLVDRWDVNSVNEALKTIPGMVTRVLELSNDNPVTLLSVDKDKRLNVVYCHEGMCFTKRLLISHYVTKTVQFHLPTIDHYFEDILEKVGEIINDAYMLATEQIIRNSNPNKDGSN